MLKHLLRTLLVFCAVVSLAACSSDSDAPESQAQTTLQLEFKLTPDNIQVKEYKHLKISFKELNSGFSTSRELTNTNVLKTVLPTGTYTISVEGSIVYSDDSGTIEGKVGGLQTGVVVNGNEQTKTVAISLKAGSGDLILEEVFLQEQKHRRELCTSVINTLKLPIIQIRFYTLTECC